MSQKIAVPRSYARRDNHELLLSRVTAFCCSIVSIITYVKHANVLCMPRKRRSWFAGVNDSTLPITKIRPARHPRFRDSFGAKSMAHSGASISPIIRLTALFQLSIRSWNPIIFWREEQSLVTWHWVSLKLKVLIDLLIYIWYLGLSSFIQIPSFGFQTFLSRNFNGVPFVVKYKFLFVSQRNFKFLSTWWFASLPAWLFFFIRYLSCMKKNILSVDLSCGN